MNIEKAIKQTKSFKSSQQKVLVNIIYSNSWILTKQKTFFKEYDLTAKQYNILRILRGARKPISTAAIRQRMLDKMPDVSRIVDRMEKKGLVSKSSSLLDNRKIDVLISKKAIKLLSTMDLELEKWNESYSNLTDVEAEELSRLLDKMRGQ